MVAAAEFDHFNGFGLGGAASSAGRLQLLLDLGARQQISDGDEAADNEHNRGRCSPSSTRSGGCCGEASKATALGFRATLSRGLQRSARGTRHGALTFTAAKERWFVRILACATTERWASEIGGKRVPFLYFFIFFRSYFQNLNLFY